MGGRSLLTNFGFFGSPLEEVEEGRQEEGRREVKNQKVEDDKKQRESGEVEQLISSSSSYVYSEEKGDT